MKNEWTQRSGKEALQDIMQFKEDLYNSQNYETPIIVPGFVIDKKQTEDKMNKQKDFHEQIQQQEEKSYNLRKQIDRETSPEERVNNMIERVLKKMKLDKKNNE